uniref:Cytochrome c oxidase subunit 3 n=1 Tax=Arrenurus rostratus TaxID=3136836 RepID=A0AAU6QDV7_9ACAR
MKKMHPFHMVTESPWPIVAALSALSLTSSTVAFSQYKSSYPLLISFLALLLSSIQWWRDVFRESSLEGEHSLKTMMGIKLGVIFFIISEVMFFVSFFWAFFQSTISLPPELGFSWPPMGINMFNPMNIPLLNTIILLSSGVSVTWAHHMILEKNLSKATKSLAITVTLGAYFTMLQGMEYWQAPFSMWDSTCGCTFFMATGFHGLHVIIGSIFLSISFYQLFNMKFSPDHLICFEAAAWYWHFVDVVWLFLYISIYWWGS